jgi:putative hydrolase
MSGFGFGFGPGSGESGDGDDLSSRIPLFAELQKLMSGGGGPVNWDLARQLAISQLAGTHRVVGAADHRVAADALRLADMWLDEVTDFPTGVITVKAWSQIDWVEQTIDSWAGLCDPVAGRVVQAMSGALPPEVAAQAGVMGPMMSQIGGLMFGAQLGQGLAGLAAEVVSSTEIGLPLGPTGAAALVMHNLEAFATEIGRPVDEVRLFMALYEAAHHRLFGHVPWLKQQLLEAVDAYGRGIKIDPDAISSALTEIDPTNPASLQNALTSGLFEPENTPAQDSALRRLETLLALIEGWVDNVVGQASAARMAGAPALAEAVRRRRASGGPAEQTFSTLVGLELRPRRLRDAATLWGAMAAKHGPAARDTLWSHPDLLPGAEDLDDPLGFAETYGVTAALDVSDFELPAEDPAAQNSTSDEAADEPKPAAGPQVSDQPKPSDEPGAPEADGPSRPV